MPSTRTLVRIFVLVAAAAALPAQEPQLAVKGLDPVELCAGRETAGRTDLNVDRHGFTYRFQSPQTRATFAADPERYEIQLGGGCARMGPLSGRGDPSRWTVFDGRIYIFASDSCRKGFLAAPERHIDGPERAPELTAEQREGGAALLDALLTATGGALEVDAVQTLRLVSQRRVESGGKRYGVQKEWHVVFPDCLRVQDAWDRSYWGTTLRGETGVSFSDRSEVEMAPCQRTALRHEWQRHPFAILRARTRADFVAGDLGEGAIAGLPVRLLVVAFDGQITTLGIEATTGRAVAARFVGRLSGPRREIEQRFTDYREVLGLTLPYTTETWLAGKEVADHKIAWSAIERDATFEAGLFPK